MALRVIEGGGNSTMTENDRMLVYMLAKMRIIEANIALLNMQSAHQESIKTSILNFHKLLEQRQIDEKIDEEEAIISLRAYKDTLHSIFGEHPLEK